MSPASADLADRIRASVQPRRLEPPHPPKYERRRHDDEKSKVGEEGTLALDQVRSPALGSDGTLLGHLQPSYLSFALSQSFCKLIKVTRR